MSNQITKNKHLQNEDIALVIERTKKMSITFIDNHLRFVINIPLQILNIKQTT